MIILSHSDVKIMRTIPKLPPALRAVLDTKIDGGSISDEQADELRDLVGDRLMEIGFDEDYGVNKIGRKLEELVDKLFTG